MCVGRAEVLLSTDGVDRDTANADWFRADPSYASIVKTNEQAFFLWPRKISVR